MASVDHPCCLSDICIACGHVCPFFEGDICLKCSRSSLCLTRCLASFQQQMSEADMQDTTNFVRRGYARNGPPASILSYYGDVNIHIGRAAGVAPFRFGQRGNARRDFRHVFSDPGTASFIRQGVQCSLLRAIQFSSAGLYAVDGQTVSCWHCGVRLDVSSLLLTPDENAYEDAVVSHCNNARNPSCQFAEGLLRIHRQTTQ